MRLATSWGTGGSATACILPLLAGGAKHVDMNHNSAPRPTLHGQPPSIHTRTLCGTAPCSRGHTTPGCCSTGRHSLHTCSTTTNRLLSQSHSFLSHSMLQHSALQILGQSQAGDILVDCGVQKRQPSNFLGHRCLCYCMLPATACWCCHAYQLKLQQHTNASPTASPCQHTPCAELRLAAEATPPLGAAAEGSTCRGPAAQTPTGCFWAIQL